MYRWKLKPWRRGLLGVALAAVAYSVSFGAFWQSVEYCRAENEANARYEAMGLIVVTNKPMYNAIGCGGMR